MSNVHLNFETLTIDDGPATMTAHRARAGLGWVVVTVVDDAVSVTFVYDPNFLWKEDTPAD